MQMELSAVALLEERAFNAWPARQTVMHDGWLFRLSDGFTKRANSVNAATTKQGFHGVRESAEDLYAAHGLPAVFRLSPLAPAGFDASLENAGYLFFDPSRVAVASLEDAPESDAAVEVSVRPTQAWLDGFAAANGVAPAQRNVHHAMVSSIAMPCGFATLYAGPRAIGFALAVLERRAVGFYDVVIAPDQRGMGHGRSLMGALMHWGRRRGAGMAYLQMRDENEPARGLYASLGFKDAYRYHYRVPGPAASARMATLQNRNPA